MYKKIKENVFLIYKERFETPLQSLEKLRTYLGLGKDVKMTYAGRLDPMAYGAMIVLAGEECRNKDFYTFLQKEYRVKIIFGLQTDTGDVFGVLQKVDFCHLDSSLILEKIKSFSNKTFSQKYPNFSTKVFSKFKNFSQFFSKLNFFKSHHSHQVSLGEVDFLSSGEVFFVEIEQLAITACVKIKGDFRFGEIKKSFEIVGSRSAHFYFVEIKMSASSGFYVRQFACDLGQSLRSCAMAFEIERTKIGEFSF